MNDAQEGFGNLHVAPSQNGGMKIPAPSERCIATPVAGDEAGACRNGALDEADQRFADSIRCHWESDAPSISAGIPLIKTSPSLALADFHGASHQHRVMSAAPFASRTVADPGFSGLDLFSSVATEPQMLSILLVVGLPDSQINTVHSWQL